MWTAMDDFCRRAGDSRDASVLLSFAIVNCIYMLFELICGVSLKSTGEAGDSWAMPAMLKHF
jgi:Co/Zn/Cd efflux system component